MNLKKNGTGSGSQNSGQKYIAQRLEPFYKVSLAFKFVTDKLE